MNWTAVAITAIICLTAYGIFRAIVGVGKKK